MLLDRETKHFTAGLINAITNLPEIDALQPVRSRLRRERGIATIKNGLVTVKKALPLWKRLNEPNYEQISEAVGELSRVIDQLRA